MVGQGRDDERHRSLETLAVLAAACLFLGLIFHARSFAHVALALLLVGLFLKPLATKLSWAWLNLSAGLGIVNSKILLTLIYYLVLTPIALVHRHVHGDFLNLTRGEPKRSHWTERSHEFGPRDLQRPW